MKQANTYKGFLDPQSEFSHQYATWAKNHRGWAKAKKETNEPLKEEYNKSKDRRMITNTWKK